MLVQRETVQPLITQSYKDINEKINSLKTHVVGERFLIVLIFHFHSCQPTK